MSVVEISTFVVFRTAGYLEVCTILPSHDEHVRTGVYQDVFLIDKHPKSQHIQKNIIHQMLKDARTVTNSEQHDKIFVKTGRSDESSHPFISLSDVHQIIGPVEVAVQKDRA